MKLYSPFLLYLAIVLGVSGQISMAGNAPSPIATEPTPQEQASIFDQLWAIPTIYKNENNPIIQKFAFEGRLHADVI